MDGITNNTSNLNILGALKNYESAKSTPKSGKKTNTVPTKSDSVNISSKSQEFERKIANLKADVSQMSYTSPAKLKEVKEKLKKGGYDQQETINQVADKIIDAFRIHS